MQMGKSFGNEGIQCTAVSDPDVPIVWQFHQCKAVKGPR